MVEQLACDLLDPWGRGSPGQGTGGSRLSSRAPLETTSLGGLSLGAQAPVHVVPTVGHVRCPAKGGAEEVCPASRGLAPRHATPGMTPPPAVGLSPQPSPRHLARRGHAQPVSKPRTALGSAGAPGCLCPCSHSRPCPRGADRWERDLRVSRQPPTE